MPARPERTLDFANAISDPDKQDQKQTVVNALEAAGAHAGVPTPDN
jgi:hypothetical protein